MPRILRFPPFELRPTARTLLREGRPVPLGARALDVLLALVEGRGELVTKDQLMERGWPGLVVEEANIHVQISLLRKVIGSDAIATVPGLGYRFAWPVSDAANASPVPHNLPAERTAFVGREAALAAAQRQLDAARLMTLVGIGGTGKTRLARRLAESMMPRFPDGVWWVDLASVDDTGRVGQAIAQAAGCPVVDDVEPTKALADHLLHRRTLLVLDNCEHVIEAVARQVDLLLSQVPGLTVLATSRDALALSGEATVPVRPMAVPPAGASDDDRCESVRLFVQAASQAHPDFTIVPTNAADIGDICRELDGLPLAIELAAAQMQVVSPSQLLAMLRERFRVLGGPRRALARQQTLRTVIQWSWEHLRLSEQRLLSALAVCVGGCDLETVLALVGPQGGDIAGAADTLAGLSRLSDLSLITVAHAGQVARYRLLETVTQFALEKISDGGDDLRVLRDRHLAHFVGRATRWATGWNGPDHEATLREADCNHENAARAMDWAVATDRWRDAVLLANHLFPWWMSRAGAHGALEAIERVLIVVPIDTADPVVADLLCHASSVAMRRGQLARSRELALRGARVAGRSGVPEAILDARIMVARIDEREGLLEAASTGLGPVIDEARQRGLDKVLGDALNVLGQVQLERKDLDAARASLIESALISQRLGHRYDIAVDGLCLATLALEADDAPEARRWMRTVAASRAAVDHRYVDQMWLDLAAWLAAAEGDWKRAVFSFRVADRFAASLQHGRSEHWRRVSGRCLEQARAAIGDAAWQAAWAGGELAALRAAVSDVDSWIVEPLPE